MAKLDKPTLAGLTLCALPVAAFSAFSQFETGRMAGIPGGLAWVLPVATDAAAFVATRVWLDEKYSKGIRRYAAAIVILCVALSIAGAALHLGLAQVRPPVWLGFAVGAIPSLVLAGLIHLGALIGAAPEKQAKATRAVPSRPKAGSPNVGAVEPVTSSTSTAPAPKPVPDPPVTAPVELKSVPKIPAPVESPEVGAGSTRDQMWAYLDKVDGQATGAELDRRFGTSNYGRGVLNAWRKRHPIASGE